MSHRVVIQLVSAEASDHLSMLRQINNLLAFFRDDVNVEVICHGNSLPLLLHDSGFKQDMKTLMMKGVRFIACQHMLTSNQKFLVDLVEGVRLVPSGIAELVLKQEAGWSYIRAGL